MYISKIRLYETDIYKKRFLKKMDIYNSNIKHIDKILDTTNNNNIFIFYKILKQVYKNNFDMNLTSFLKNKDTEALLNELTKLYKIKVKHKERLKNSNNIFYKHIYKKVYSKNELKKELENTENKDIKKKVKKLNSIKNLIGNKIKQKKQLDNKIKNLENNVLNNISDNVKNLELEMKKYKKK